MGIWAREHLGTWASGHVGIWARGHLDFWAPMHIKIWASRLLSIHLTRTTLHDFVTKTETAEEDSLEVLRVLFPELSEERIHEVKIGGKYVWNGTHRIDKVSKDENMDQNKMESTLENMSSIDKQKIKEDLPEELKTKLRQKLYWDLRMFGYEY